MKYALSLEKINKKHKDCTILKDVNLKIAKGRSVALVGPSGSGKTTLLQIAGLIDKPTSGKVYLEGKDTFGFKEKEINQALLEKISFIYQFHHILPEFSALENIELVLIAKGLNKTQARKIAIQNLKEVGLEKVIHSRPNAMSGGERQRVAIARAISKSPSIILADEPTGNLDPQTADGVVDSIIQQTKSKGISLLCVTHNLSLIKKFEDVYEIKDFACTPYNKKNQKSSKLF